MYAPQSLPENSARARNASTMMLITMVISAITTLLALLKLFAKDMIFSSYYIVYGEGLLGLAEFTIMILSAVFFIMWFRRAYNNLFICGVRGLPYKEGWAAGGWFVPIVSLFYPYRIMNCIWSDTQSAIRKQGEHYERREDGNIGWWWAFWITSNIISNIQVQLTFRGMFSQYDDTIIGMELISNAASVVAAYLCWKMIKKTSEMESDLQGRYREWQMWQTQQQAQQYQQSQAFGQ